MGRAPTGKRSHKKHLGPPHFASLPHLVCVKFFPNFFAEFWWEALYSLSQCKACGCHLTNTLAMLLFNRKYFWRTLCFYFACVCSNGVAWGHHPIQGRWFFFSGRKAQKDDEGSGRSGYFRGNIATLGSCGCSRKTCARTLIILVCPGVDGA